jgi:ribosomal protein S17E
MTAPNGPDNDYEGLKATVEELRRSNEELRNRMTGYEQETVYEDEEEEEDILKSQPLAEEL